MLFRFEVINMPVKIMSLDSDHIVNLYAKGIGVTGIADKFGISKSPIERILRENGIPLRNCSEQQQARMDKSTPEQKAAQTRAAHDALRGKKRSAIELNKRARTRERTKSHVSALELRVERLLKNTGIDTKTQTAIGPYNCDFTCDAVAVEIWGGGWHWHGRHIARSEERFRFIMDRGFNIIIACIDSRRRHFGVCEAEQLAFEIKAANANPTILRHYRMIWCGTDFATATSADADHFSFEPPFTGARDPATGQYQTFAR